MTDTYRVDLLVDKGSDFAFQLYWTDQYDEPLTITYPMKMTVAFGAPQTYISVTETPTGGELAYISYNAEAGFIQLSLPDSHTNTFTVGQYKYDLWAHISDPDDVVNTTKRAKIIEGNFNVLSSVTTF